MATWRFDPATMCDPDLQNLFSDDLLPGQILDSGMVEQGPRIKAIMDELEEKYIRIREDIQRGRFSVSPSWDINRKLPVVYEGGEQADTLTTLMVHHAALNPGRDLPFFIPGSCGRIRPCGPSYGFMFVGLYKHTYIRGAHGNVVPMPNEPANAEEGKALDMIITSCQRVGLLPAHPSQKDVEDVKNESLRLLRKTEAEMFTGQLIMSRVMVERLRDTTRKDDRDEDPAATGGYGGSSSTQRDQHTATASRVAGQTSTPTQTAPHKTNLVIRSRTPSIALPTGLSAHGVSAMNDAPSTAAQKSGTKMTLRWMPIATQSSMNRTTDATKPTEGVDTIPDSDGDSRKQAKSAHKRRRVANVVSVDGAYSSSIPDSESDCADSDTNSCSSNVYQDTQQCAPLLSTSRTSSSTLVSFEKTSL